MVKKDLRELVLIDGFGNEVSLYYNAFFPESSNKLVAKIRRFIERKKR